MISKLSPNIICPINKFKFLTLRHDTYFNSLGLEIDLFCNSSQLFIKEFDKAYEHCKDLRVSPHLIKPQINIWIPLNEEYEVYLESILTIDNIVPKLNVYFAFDKITPDIKKLVTEVVQKYDLVSCNFIYALDCNDLSEFKELIAKSKSNPNTLLYIFSSSIEIKQHVFTDLNKNNYPYLNHRIYCCDIISKNLRNYFQNGFSLHNTIELNEENGWSCLCDGFNYLFKKRKIIHDINAIIPSNTAKDVPIINRKNTLYNDWHYIYDSFEMY